MSAGEPTTHEEHESWTAANKGLIVPAVPEAVKALTIEPVTEAQGDLEVLLDKLEKFLVQQPEWIRVIGTGDRATRKRVAALIAKSITAIPHRDGQVFNRELRRKLVRAMEGGET